MWRCSSCKETIRSGLFSSSLRNTVAQWQHCLICLIRRSACSHQTPCSRCCPVTDPHFAVVLFWWLWLKVSAHGLLRPRGMLKQCTRLTYRSQYPTRIFVQSRRCIRDSTRARKKIPDRSSGSSTRWVLPVCSGGCSRTPWCSHGAHPCTRSGYFLKEIWHTE